MSENRGNGAASPPTDDLRGMIAAATAENTRPDPVSPPPVQPPATEPGKEEPPPAPDQAPPETPDHETPPPAAADRPDSDGAEERVFRDGPPRAGAAPADAQPPANWAKADKDKFLALPVEARAPFLDLFRQLQGGYTQKLQRGAQLEKDYGEIDRQVFTADQRRILAEQGVSVPAMINAWAAVERSLGNPQTRDDLMARIIHAYAGDPAAIARRLNELRGFASPPAGSDDGASNGAGGGAPVPRTQVDPQLAARLDRLETDQRARTLADQQSRDMAASRLIENFANEVDESGQLTHPFFAEVETDMTGLAQLDRALGKEPDITDLYNRAVWANEITRDKQLALQRDAASRRQAEERKAKAEQARRAGSSISGAPGPGVQSTAASELSLRDQIKATMSNGRPETSGGRGRI